MLNIQNIIDNHVALAYSVQSLSKLLAPTIGEYKWTCRQSDYSGWVLCDGRSLSRESNKDLFEIIGTAFGADSDILFNIPDYRGRVLGAIGQGIGLTNRTLGDNTGAETHQLAINELPAHTHSGRTDVSGTHTHDTNAIGGQGNAGLVVADGTGANTTSESADGKINVATTPTTLNIVASGDHTHAFTTNSIGGGGVHNNMQPTVFGGSIFIFIG